MFIFRIREKLRNPIFGKILIGFKKEIRFEIENIVFV